jgi:hypothetical protein
MAGGPPPGSPAAVGPIEVQRSSPPLWSPARDAENEHMSHPNVLRAAGAAATVLALALAPAAQARSGGPSVPVCNQASPHFQGGGLVALDPPVDSPAARYTDDLYELPGRGEGLVTAAEHSPALTVCGEDDGGEVIS